MMNHAGHRGSQRWKAEAARESAGCRLPPEVRRDMKLSVIGCYVLAWRCFSKWWIPLCVISGIVVVFQIIPRILVRADVNELEATTRSLVTAVLQNDLAELEEISAKVAAQTGVLMRKLTTYGLYLFPIVALLTIILLMYANWAVKNRQEARRPLPTLVYIAFVHVMLAIAKLSAFFFFFVPGAYLYIKLLFVSLIMLETKKGASAAIRISWRMTSGNFWRLFLLVLMNTGIQLLALPTIIGEIPVTGFANTARAAAFRMIWEESNYAET
jgi:hypothetical protein